jgi:hypothetical protein
MMIHSMIRVIFSSPREGWHCSLLLIVVRGVLTLQAVLDLLVVGTFSLLSSFDLSQHVVQIVDGFLLILLACLHDDVRHK